MPENRDSATVDRSPLQPKANFVYDPNLDQWVPQTPGGAGTIDTSQLSTSANQTTEIAKLEAIRVLLDVLSDSKSVDDLWNKIEAVRALLAGTLNVNTGLSLAGLATDAGLSAIVAKLTSDPSTSAKQDAQKAVLDNILAKIIASPATESTLSGMSGKLPATLGQKTGANSLSVVVASDQGTLTTSTAARTVTNYVFTFSAGSLSMSTNQNLSGLTAVRLVMPAAWNTAVLTIQTSSDGVTWQDLYDSSGAVYTIQVSASRNIILNPSELLGIRFIRFRSGLPGSTINQVDGTTITLVTANL